MRFAPDARRFIATKRRARRQAVIAVHPHATRFQRTRHAQRTVNIARPHTAAQAVFAVVSHGNHFFFRFELNHRCHRAKNFLLRHTRRVAVHLNQSRLNKFPASQIARHFFTACDDAAALLFTNFHIFQNRFQLPRVHLRTHLRIIFPRQAQFHFFKFLCQRSHEFIVNPLLHKNPRTRTAHLPLVEQNAFLRPFQGFIKRHIVKENVGRFAAQFQSRRNQQFRCSNAHAATHFG